MSGWSGPSTRSRISSAAIKRLSFRSFPGNGRVRPGVEVGTPGITSRILAIKTRCQVPDLATWPTERLNPRETSGPGTAGRALTAT